VGFLSGRIYRRFARALIKLKIELPYGYRDSVTKGIVLIPGVLGEVLLGMIAALVLGA
jgi:hypothetical protein